jgi:hypothetical protein
MCALSKTLPPPPETYAGVARLAGNFMAIYVNGKEKNVLSKNPETDLKVAQAAAKRFSETHDIPFFPLLVEGNKPILTVIKSEGKWFPAKLYPEKIHILRNLGPMPLGSCQSDAAYWAEAIAQRTRSDCVPSIGISLSEKTH